MHEKVGLGGGCHWCTEAVFQSLKGVGKVEQGWICSTAENSAPSEAVLVGFCPQEISLHVLIEIHLHTHSCTSDHSMREKYRSAVYVFDDSQAQVAMNALKRLQVDFEEPIITQVIPFCSFKLNDEIYLNYYTKNPEKPFCETNISPKLKQLHEKFGMHTKQREFFGH